MKGKKKKKLKYVFSIIYPMLDDYKIYISC